MASYTTPLTGDLALAEHIAQFSENAQGLRNIPQSFTGINDAAAYALTLKNAGAGSKALLIYAADGTTVLLQVDATGVKVSSDGVTPAAGGFVTLTGTQTLTNKTLTSPVLNTPTFSAGAIAAAALAAGAAASNVGALGVTSAMLAADAVTTAKVLDANVTTAKLAANAISQVQMVTQSSDLSTTSGTYVDVPGVTVTMTTTGGPLWVIWSGPASNAGGTITMTWARDGVDGNIEALIGSGTPSDALAVVQTMWQPAAGSHTIKLRAKVSAGTSVMRVSQCASQMVVVEFKR